MPFQAFLVIAATAVLVIAGCAVGPNYKRPAVDAPNEYRTAGPVTNSVTSTNSFADLGWWEVFADPQLRLYVGEALTNNWDIKIAAARVLQAEASAKVVRSQFFPNIAVGGDLVTTRTSEVGPAPPPAGINPQEGYGTAFASMSAYEVDLWGKIRRANEAARARLLATEAAQQTVRQTLVSDVAATYLTLLELDYELEVSRRSYAVRTNSLALTTAREEGGVASLQDVVQARVLVATAEAVIVDVLRRQEQKENELCILLGRNPGSLNRGLPLVDQPLRTDVPAGLPSTLLERRPEIRSAEQQLVAANANVGEAKAAFFPQLTLTGTFGYQSVSLSDLFTGPARVWQFGPTLTLPVFTGGRLKGQYQFAKARFEEAAAQYQQTVQSAFRDVSDALIQYRRTREFTVRQQESTQARREAAELANIRYDGGVTSYLEVLYSEQELFTSELQLAQALGNELLSVVQLYRALGGGWATPAVHQASTKNKQP
jgi:multidrug efflux system outer membrane protein